MNYEWASIQKGENAIAFQIKMDFLTIRESDNSWKLDRVTSYRWTYRERIEKLTF